MAHYVMLTAFCRIAACLCADFTHTFHITLMLPSSVHPVEPTCLHVPTSGLLEKMIWNYGTLLVYVHVVYVLVFNRKY